MDSKTYWARREAEALRHRITDEKEYARRLQRIYSDMLVACQTEINAFYGKYAAAEGITIATAKRRVKKADIAAFERKAARYVRDKDFSAKANEEMRLYNAMMRINRLEMLKANIGLEMIAGHDELEKFMSGILRGRTMDELERQAGILGKTVLNNAAKAEAIVNASFHNATFSDRVWAYQDLLKDELDKLITTGLIQGKNPRVLAAELKKRFGASAYNAERLMRTELARVQTDAQKQSFIRNGYEHYEFIVNGGCCDICQALSGKHFKVVKMMPGENAPPMHPHCRCSTAAWVDGKDYEAWLDYLDKGGTTAEWDKMTAAEKRNWRKGLTKTAKSAKMAPRKVSPECQTLLDTLKTRGVERRDVGTHSTPLSNDEIIRVLSGGDLTSGSCASVGLAYMGQKGGLDVLDFRGGKSLDFFSTKSNLRAISKLPGVTTHTEVARSSVTAGNKLLKRLEVGKEYYLCCGRHAAIVRKTADGKLQYLELQSATRSGWRDFDGNPRYTLKTRFGENKGYDVEDFMIEVDTLAGSDDLAALLEYISTADDKQRKGSYGTIK